MNEGPVKINHEDTRNQWLDKPTPTKGTQLEGPSGAEKKGHPTQTQEAQSVFISFPKLKHISENVKPNSSFGVPHRSEPSRNDSQEDLHHEEGVGFSTGSGSGSGSPVSEDAVRASPGNYVIGVEAKSLRHGESDHYAVAVVLTDKHGDSTMDEAGSETYQDSSVQRSSGSTRLRKTLALARSAGGEIHR